MDLLKYETKDIWLASALQALGFPAPSAHKDAASSERKPLSVFRFFYPPEREDELTKFLVEYKAGDPTTNMGLIRRFKDAYLGNRTASWAHRKEPIEEEVTTR